MDSIDYYNRYAVPYYESTIDLDMSEIMQPFLEELPENAEVLDLGCGSGRDSLVLEEQGCLVTSLDGSEEMCKLDLMEEIGGSKVIDIWRTSDVRSGREDKIWLNALVKKRQ